MGTIKDRNGVDLTEVENNISQFIWKHKKTPNSQTILRKKNGARGISFLTSDNSTELQPSGYDTISLH